MVANRQDAWTKEEDNYLAEVVLKSINEGSTQLTAFKIVAGGLSRTPAACGYRWNSFVRKFYKEEIDAAKSNSKMQVSSKDTARKKVVSPNSEVFEQNSSEEVSFKIVYDFLENLRKKIDSPNYNKEIQSLEKKLLKSKLEIEELKKEKQRLLEKISELESEYENLFNYIDQKRKFVSVGNFKSEEK